MGSFQKEAAMGIKHTLGAAVDAGAEFIALFCISCPSTHEFTPAFALVHWGPDATFPQIAARSRCKRCGQQASEAAPIWPQLMPERGGSPRPKPKGWENLDTKNPTRFSKR